jgi:hypothetical protein
MKTNGKYIIQVTGPLVKYRLDILAKVCPEARHFLLVLTNKFSYNLYKEYHDFFEFIIMDDYRENHPASLEHEIFPEYETEEIFLENIKTFYGNSTGKFYSYDIQRFIFPYLIENNILNFSFIDSDFILINDFNVLNEYFTKIPSGTCYGPWHGEDMSNRERKSKMWGELQYKFPQIKFESPFLRTIDGFMRGFHFRNKEEMELLYNIWNSALDDVFVKTYNGERLFGQHNVIIMGTEWVISHIMQFFEYQFNYSFVDCYEFIPVKGTQKEIGRHGTRPEDTIYAGERPQWRHHNFDYSDTRTISNFIKNNKEQLYGYYNGHFKNITITDTHVYTSIL